MYGSLKIRVMNTDTEIEKKDNNGATIYLHRLHSEHTACNVNRVS